MGLVVVLEEEELALLLLQILAVLVTLQAHLPHKVIMAPQVLRGAAAVEGVEALVKQGVQTVLLKLEGTEQHLLFLEHRLLTPGAEAPLVVVVVMAVVVAAA
jgi:hypothetical protein